MAWGPPNFGEHPKTDSRFPVWIIKLDYPITVITGLDIGAPKQTVLALEIQIQLGSRMGDMRPGLLGKHVVAQGRVHTQVFPSDTTPVVIDASDVRIGSPLPCNG